MSGPGVQKLLEHDLRLAVAVDVRDEGSSGAPGHLELRPPVERPASVVLVHLHGNQVDPRILVLENEIRTPVPVEINDPDPARVVPLRPKLLAGESERPVARAVPGRD